VPESWRERAKAALPVNLANSSLFIRDLAKAVFLGVLHLRTRLFYLDREPGSSIHLSARLDVIPRGPHHARHRLILRKHALIERLCTVNTWNGDVTLEDSAGIGIGTVVIGPVHIGAHTLCAQHCLITGQSHQFADPSKLISEQGFVTKPVLIEENVWIGANCVVLPGVQIGRSSVIGAGSVVTREIPPLSLAVGNPARVIKCYSREQGAWLSV
jgi:acetyltransferase-like isoleucine patch superfamily enzyme